MLRPDFLTTIFTHDIPVSGALLEYAAILLLLKKKRMPLRKLEKSQNGHKIENITAAGALPSDNLRRKSLTNGDFDKTLDLEVRNIKLFQIFFITKYFCVSDRLETKALPEGVALAPVTRSSVKTPPLLIGKYFNVSNYFYHTYYKYFCIF